MAGSDRLASPTLARLYLQQGSLDKAQQIAANLPETESGQNGMEAAIHEAAHARVETLQALLTRVRERRR